ncbi:MAG: HDOD domain-containing protein [Gammaproteobacteria bacterium]
MPISVMPKMPPRARALDTAEKWIAETSDLASPPEICATVFDLLRSPTASARDFGEVISRDPNLTARLLRMVNSSFYGLPTSVDTVSRAIAIIGNRELHSLMLAVTAAISFANIASTLVNMDTFWRHSVYCALLSRALARRCRVLHPERLFVLGLLHDLGSLVIYRRVPQLAAQLLEQAQGSEQALYHLELEQLGFSHADVGGLLLRRWSLPETLQQAVQYHHNPADAPNVVMEANIVHIGDILANCSELGAFSEQPAAEHCVAPQTWQALGLSEAQISPQALIGEAGLQFAETAEMLTMRR